MNADVADDDGVVGHRKLDLARRSLRRDRTRIVTEARRHQGVPLLAMAVYGRQPLAARRRVGRLATRGRGLEELPVGGADIGRSEEHTSETQSLMHNWIAVW